MKFNRSLKLINYVDLTNCFGLLFQKRCYYFGYVKYPISHRAGISNSLWEAFELTDLGRVNTPKYITVQSERYLNHAESDGVISLYVNNCARSHKNTINQGVVQLGEVLLMPVQKRTIQPILDCFQEQSLVRIKKICLENYLRYAYVENLASPGLNVKIKVGWNETIAIEDVWSCLIYNTGRLESSIVLGTKKESL